MGSYYSKPTDSYPATPVYYNTIGYDINDNLAFVLGSRVCSDVGAHKTLDEMVQCMPISNRPPPGVIYQIKFRAPANMPVGKTQVVPAAFWTGLQATHPGISDGDFIPLDTKLGYLAQFFKAAAAKGEVIYIEVHLDLSGV